MTEILMTRTQAGAFGRRALACALFVAAVLAVLTPAIWNGFPLLFPDTAGYLARPLTGTLELGRSAIYGAFLVPGIRTFFWINIALQATLVVWLTALILRIHGFGKRPLLLFAVTLALSALTSMAWYAATLMPDIWLPAAVLALYLLAFQTRTLQWQERIGLIGVVAFAIASHMGTLAVCLALAAGLAVLRVLPRRPFRNFPRPQLMMATIAVGVGLLLAPISNLAIGGQFKFTPGGDSFLFGRLVQDGIIARYLQDRCPDATIRLCAYRDKMPDSADDWLWAPGNILSALGGWEHFAKEERRIVFETIKMYPAAHIIEAATTTLQQLSMMQTEVALVPDWMEPTTGAFREIVPQMTPTMMSARQQANPFTGVMTAINWVHVPVAALSLAALIGLLLLSHRGLVPPEVLALAAMVVLAVLANAIICGTFSNPVNRYESRLIWLAPLAVVIAALTFKTRVTKPR
jgi:hypothetical protein